MARKPKNLIYGVNDIPPFITLVLLGFQLVSCSAALLVMPAIIAQASGASSQVAMNIVSVSMLAWAVGAILQAQIKGPIGSGYLALPNNSGTYLAPSMLAASLGGLPLVAGMTIFAGFCHTFISPFLRYLRKWLPPEIGAVVLLLIGIELGTMGLNRMFGMDEVASAAPVLGLSLIGVISLLIMVICNIWFKNSFGRYCVLIGIIFGYALTILMGFKNIAIKTDIIAQAQWFGLPHFSFTGYSFDKTLIIPFFIAALVSAVKSSSLIIAAQKANDADWIKPDTLNISKGNMADGIACLISGLFGSMGQNISSSSIGIPAQTGVTSRYIAYSFAAIFILLSFSPKFVSVFLAIPDVIIGAMLVFTGITVFISAQQILMELSFDTKRNILVGLSFLCGLSFPLHPDYYAHLPTWIREFTGSSYTIAAVVGILTNVAFQLGAKKKYVFKLLIDEDSHAHIETQMRNLQEQWNVSSATIHNATLAIKDMVSTAINKELVRDNLKVRISSDSVCLKVKVFHHEHPIGRNASMIYAAKPKKELSLMGYLRNVTIKLTGRTPAILAHRFDHS